MGSVEHDLRIHEHEQSKAYARDEYAVANRDRFMLEAIDEEIRADFANNLAAAAEQLCGADNKEVAPFIDAYLSDDDLWLGQLVRRLVRPLIEESAVARAERMAAEEFDVKY